MSDDLDEERARARRIRRLIDAEAVKDVRGLGGEWRSGRVRGRKGGRL